MNGNRQPQIAEQSTSKKDESHMAAQRMIRQSKEQPAGFDERARANSEKVKGIHEFRRGNIKDYEAPDKDFFDYDPQEKSRKYDGLKLETIFRFGQTYKAIQWGVLVGSMFAAHRYYRTRSIENAAYWFSVMSLVSGTNIWISYGLQEAVTEFGSRKSISLQQRSEYHDGAYKTYIERLANDTHAIDSKVLPSLSNETGKVLSEFRINYISKLQQVYGTEDMSEAQILAKVQELRDIERAEKEGRVDEVRALTP